MSDSARGGPQLGFGTDAGVVGRRLIAYLVDAVVLGGVAFASAGERHRLRRAVAIAGGGGLLYHVLLEGTWGQTLGKRLLGIVVRQDDGGSCTYGAAAIRTALRPVDWLPVGYVVGLAAIVLTEEDQRVGDLAADTRVVRTASRAEEGAGRPRPAVTTRGSAS